MTHNNKSIYIKGQEYESFERDMDFSLLKYNEGLDYYRYEIIDDLCNYEHLKCRFIYSMGYKYLLRCGKHLLQVWKLGDESLANDNQCNQLVYIKPYTNSFHRSFYLSPNIWMLKSFNGIKYFDGPQQKIVVDIVEDSNYLSKDNRKHELTICTEEIILPLSRDNNVFDYHLFESACQALYYFNISIIEDNDYFSSQKFLTSQAYQVGTSNDRMLISSYLLLN